MSCGSDIYSEDCVCSTLAAIAEAQEKIEDDCHTGCRRSIEELKGCVKPKGFDTIPVLLTIDGRPFSAVGATRSNSRDHKFNIFKSFLFRVNDVSSGTCCATLELLKPVKGHHDCYESSSSSHKHESSSSYKHDNNNCTDFCDFLDALEDSDRIVRTGICVTVDLNDFTSVSCFPAVHTD